MTTMTRYDPFGELARFDPFRDLDNMFRMPRTFMREMPTVPEIKMDVIEDDKAYRVKADIPGVKKEDIKVSIDGNNVSISAEMHKESEEKNGEMVIRSERYYGNQYRGFTLASDVDSTRSEAKYENGVLELMLPKKEPATAKQVAVK